MDTTELCFTPATELSRQIRTRKLSPVELVDAVLDRTERLNPKLNAFLTVTTDLARQQAHGAEERARRGALLGPLDGIPYSVKDLEPTAGVRTTFGSKWFEQHVPTEDGVVAGRLKATGAVLLGKTNTPNFGHKDNCDNLLGSPCRNPWKLDRTSGASSGGAGAAVAAGLGPLAHGSDGAGSIRIPSALCGIVGFKPSFGRIPSHPSTDYWAARSHNGPMTRTVRDAALLLGAMAGPDPRDPLSIDAPPEDYLVACDGDLQGLRIVWSADLGYAPVDPEVRRITEAAARRFEELGAKLEARDPGWPDPGAFHRIIYEVNVAARQVDRAAEHPEWIEPSLMQMIENARRVSAIEHAKALLARSVFYDQARRFFETCDLLLTPQMPVGAWSAEPGPNQGPKTIGGRPTPTMFDRLPFTFPFNLTGQPAASVPCGFTSEGLPVALQIVGRWHADALVLRAAACFEAIRPWAAARPPLD
ncbi:MAG: amidase [Candidatus Rokubacteria bacterium]|nr:amidase [Candidatus Rokubacteria bacterium]